MFIGYTTDNKELTIPSKSLATHAAVLGSTGSGKTGLILSMAEELHEEGIPTILIDIKGDMINIALHSKEMLVRCFTPGGKHGESINVLADLQDPQKSPTIVSSLLAMIGEDSDPMTSRAHAYLTTVLDHLPEPDLHDLIVGCQYPDFNAMGAMEVDEAYPKASRLALARKLNTLLISPSFDLWQTGEALNIDHLIESKGITVYSVAHLINKDEQGFAISFLANEVLQWMKQQKGSKEVRLVVGIDECLGLFPPYPANPPTKAPIMQLLKQARAFGVGLILGTQNPVDIDYKALSNCGTWFVGRMTANKDRSKVVEGMSAGGLAEREAINKTIAGLYHRQFVVADSKQVQVFRTRDTNCTLTGPLIPEELRALYEQGYLTHFPPSIRYGRGAKPHSKVLAVEEVEDHNILNSALGLLGLGAFGYMFILIFEYIAQYIKDTL